MQARKNLWLWAGAVLCGVALLVPQGCSREPHFSLLPLNQAITIMPASVNSMAPIKATTPKLSGVHLTVRWEGEEMGREDPDATIRFYHKDSAQPFYQASWSELKTAYRSSGCNKEQIATLDGPMEAALFCDGRLGNIDDIVKVDAVSIHEGETLKCTTVSTYQRADDVLAVVAQLY